jgi:hypothetical protein
MLSWAIWHVSDDQAAQGFFSASEAWNWQQRRHNAFRDGPPDALGISSFTVTAARRRLFSESGLTTCCVIVPQVCGLGWNRCITTLWYH